MAHNEQYAAFTFDSTTGGWDAPEPPSMANTLWRDDGTPMSEYTANIKRMLELLDRCIELAQQVGNDEQADRLMRQRLDMMITVDKVLQDNSND